MSLNEFYKYDEFDIFISIAVWQIVIAKNYMCTINFKCLSYALHYYLQLTPFKRLAFAFNSAVLKIFVSLCICTEY